jgi:hypothetical protein
VQPFKHPAGDPSALNMEWTRFDHHPSVPWHDVRGNSQSVAGNRSPGKELPPALRAALGALGLHTGGISARHHHSSQLGLGMPLSGAASPEPQQGGEESFSGRTRFPGSRETVAVGEGESASASASALASPTGRASTTPDIFGVADSRSQTAARVSAGDEGLGLWSQASSPFPSRPGTPSGRAAAAATASLSTAFSARRAGVGAFSAAGVATPQSLPASRGSSPARGLTRPAVQYETSSGSNVGALTRTHDSRLAAASGVAAARSGRPSRGAAGAAAAAAGQAGAGVESPSGTGGRRSSPVRDILFRARQEERQRFHTFACEALGREVGSAEVARLFGELTREERDSMPYHAAYAPSTAASRAASPAGTSGDAHAGSGRRELRAGAGAGAAAGPWRPSAAGAVAASSFPHPAPWRRPPETDSSMHLLSRPAPPGPLTDVEAKARCRATSPERNRYNPRRDGREAWRETQAAPFRAFSEPHADATLLRQVQRAGQEDLARRFLAASSDDPAEVAAAAASLGYSHLLGAPRGGSLASTGGDRLRVGGESPPPAGGSATAAGNRLLFTSTATSAAGSRSLRSPSQSFAVP